MTKKQEVITALNSVKGAWARIAKDVGLDRQHLANIANEATLKVDSDVIETLHNYFSKPLADR